MNLNTAKSKDLDIILHQILSLPSVFFNFITLNIRRPS